MDAPAGRVAATAAGWRPCRPSAGHDPDRERPSRPTLSVICLNTLPMPGRMRSRRAASASRSRRRARAASRGSSSSSIPRCSRAKPGTVNRHGPSVWGVPARTTAGHDRENGRCRAVCRRGCDGAWREAHSMRELRAGAAIIVLALVVAACGDTPATPAPSPGRRRPRRPSPRRAPRRPARPVARGDVRARRPSTSRSPPPTTSRTRSSRRPSPSTRRRRSARRRRTRPGKIDIDGRASHLVRTDATGKSKTKVETITGNGTRYVKVKGVWTKAGRPTRPISSRSCAASRRSPTSASRTRTAPSSTTSRRPSARRHPA